MAQLPGWMPILLDRISWGCSTSPLFAQLAEEEKVMVVGKEICAELLPFIKELPSRIGAVRDKVPASMEAARNLLGQLADDERHYQGLFLKQCELAGLSQDEIESAPIVKATVELCQTMEDMCCRRDYVDGIHAVVAAELAATMFARSVAPSYETHFQKKKDQYDKAYVDEGLAWLRLHAKPHTRHAIWMMRMLGDIEDASGNDIPEAADRVIGCILRLWRCPNEESRIPPVAAAAR
jgi:pyrroloquinoline quinone (PQQ) biosynthesis protein C